jgi:hypothetical protein
MKKFALIFFCMSLLLPFIAAADDSTTYQYQRQGIFDCNKNGAALMSVGAESAVGGAYVPVADAAVELNTGILVYKECILREVVDAERQRALAQYLQNTTETIQSGRSGNPMYVKSVPQDLGNSIYDPTFITFEQDNGIWSNVNSTDQAALKRAIAQDYENQRDGSQAAALKCPLSGDIAAYRSGQTTGSGDYWQKFMDAASPQCDPVFEKFRLQGTLNSRLTQNEQNQLLQWQYGNGYYSRTNNTFDPAQQVVLTPSYNVAQSYNQILQSPIQQLQSANDIGQMIGAMYAGVTSQILGDNQNIQGLAGLTSSVGGQPSYLDQVVAESQAGLQNVTSYATLENLYTAQSFTAAILQLLQSTGSVVSQTVTQLRSGETQCWKSVISAACSTAPAADNTCTARLACTVDATGKQTCPPNITLKIATSTKYAFAQSVINAQVATYQTTNASNTAAVAAELQTISNLITEMNNPSTAQSAMQQVDQLLSTFPDRTTYDAVQKQQAAVQNAIDAIPNSVANIWGGIDSNGSATIPWDGTVNPGTGWCNAGNTATIAAWQQVWKK